MNLFPAYLARTLKIYIRRNSSCGKSEYAKQRTTAYGSRISCALCHCHGEAGIASEADAEVFLHSTTVHDPAKIRNIDAVSDLIWDHIYSGKKICIFGDYDADGITGAAILYLALRRLGAKVVVRLPDRIEEGYGFPCRR